MKLFELNTPVILASGSPRRQEFLRELGIDYNILLPSQFEEKIDTNKSPLENVKALAIGKAHAVLKEFPKKCKDNLIITADTIVVIENKNNKFEILGKPKKKEEALEMLLKLSGKKHTVITACCLILPNREEIYFSDSTDVYFHNWNKEILKNYAHSGEGLDKAGAYGIQAKGVFLVERIEGAWSTVVGFPVHLFVQNLHKYKLVK